MSRVCSIVGCGSTKRVGFTDKICCKHRSRMERYGRYDLLPKRKGWVKDGIGYIPLTRGEVALVDPEDLPRLTTRNWRVDIDSGGRKRAVGCFRRNKRGVALKMHREVMGNDNPLEIDHINRNGLDNRKSNLRFCTSSQNKANRGKMSTAKCSKYIGVFWHGRDELWIARVTLRGKVNTIGYFKEEEDAAIARDVAAQLFFGEFAVLNSV